MIEIRREEPGDTAAIEAVHRAAFQRDEEANIVDALRRHDAALLSLVAS